MTSMNLCTIYWAGFIKN